MLVSFCGLATSLLTAIILWWVELRFGFAFYSWTFWFILPIGAGLSGCAAASGYYAGSRIFNQRPTRLLLLNILLVSVATFFTIYYLSYITLEIEGQGISDYISFGQYLDIAIRSTAMEFRFGATDELGGWGYGIAILQILGFAGGGLAVYGHLVSIPYCERCSRYFSKKGKQTRYTGDTEALGAATDQLFRDWGANGIAAGIENHRVFGNPEVQAGDYLRSVIEVQHCKRCGRHRVNYQVEKQSGNDWKEITDLTTGGFTDQAVDVER